MRSSRSAPKNCGPSWPKPVPPPRLSVREKRDVLLRLRDVVRTWKDRDPRAWARTLEDRVKRGERLTAGQKHCLHELRSPVVRSDEDAFYADEETA